MTELSKSLIDADIASRGHSSIGIGSATQQRGGMLDAAAAQHAATVDKQRMTPTDLVLRRVDNGFFVGDGVRDGRLSAFTLVAETPAALVSHVRAWAERHFPPAVNQMPGAQQPVDAALSDAASAAMGVMMHTFGTALYLMREKGHRMARAGWNGKQQFVTYVPERVTHGGMTAHHIVICTPDGKLTPWLASQTDMLTDDWQVYTGPIFGARV